MKKTLLLSAVLSATFLSAGAQVFTNAGMETWHNFTVTGLALETPDTWHGTDSLIAAMAPLAGLAGISITPVKQLYKSDAIKHTGNSAAEVRSGFIGAQGGNIPGVLVNAKVSVDLLGLLGSGALEDPSAILEFLSYSEATAVDGVVDNVKAWVRMGDASMDDGTITVFTVKTVAGSSGDSTVFVGTGSLTVPKETTEFTEVTVPVTAVTGDIPQRLIVVFASSDVSGDSVHVGNSMYVDDASFTYSQTSIRQPIMSENKLLVYPNPANGQLYFNLDAGERAADYELSVADVTGRTVLQEKLQQQINEKNVADWVKGSYFYTLTNNRTGKTEKGKFVVR